MVAINSHARPRSRPRRSRPPRSDGCGARPTPTRPVQFDERAERACRSFDVALLDLCELLAGGAGDRGGDRRAGCERAVVVDRDRQPCDLCRGRGRGPAARHERGGDEHHRHDQPLRRQCPPGDSARSRILRRIVGTGQARYYGRICPSCRRLRRESSPQLLRLPPAAAAGGEDAQDVARRRGARCTCRAGVRRASSSPPRQQPVLAGRARLTARESPRLRRASFGDERHA